MVCLLHWDHVYPDAYTDSMFANGTMWNFDFCGFLCGHQCPSVWIWLQVQTHQILDGVEWCEKSPYCVCSNKSQWENLCLKFLSPLITLDNPVRNMHIYSFHLYQSYMTEVSPSQKWSAHYRMKPFVTASGFLPHCSCSNSVKICFRWCLALWNANCIYYPKPEDF